MSPMTDSLLVLASVFGSGMLGLSLRGSVPAHYLAEDSVAMVRLCTGVIATLAALVLGLLVASAKANYDRVNDQVTQAAASIVLLDRIRRCSAHSRARRSSSPARLRKCAC